MIFRVKLFGPQARLAGCRELAVDLPESPSTCSMLRDALARTHQELAGSIPSSRLAVNHEYAGDDDPIQPGDEIALIGLISGG